MGGAAVGVAGGGAVGAGIGRAAGGDAEPGGHCEIGALEGLLRRLRFGGII